MNVKLLELCIVFCLLRYVSGVEDEIETSCNINVKKAIQYVGEKFLSFTIDPAVLLAGVSLSENSLRLAKQLSPAFIRIAGPSTPFVKYFDKDDRLPTYLSEDGNNVVISPSMWFGINEWLKLANLVPIFGLNDADTARGVWNPKATLPLLEISDKLNVSCYWQLGYDSSNKSETRYMQDLNILDYVLAAFPERNETWKIVGSDISHISREKPENTLEEVKDIVTAVMWEPSGVKDDSFPENDMASKLLQRSPRPNVKLWTTAPKSEGPVTFSSALLWAKQLGNAAKTGYDVVFRQPRIHELFSDTPAYWFSLLHKKLMGSNVLEARATTSHAGTNIYAHCTRKQNSFVRRGAMTVMIVNDNSSKYKVKVKLGTTLPEKSMEVQTYLLTSSGLNSTVVSLNGRLLTQDILQNKFPFEPKIRRSKSSSHILLAVPPHSIGFFVLPGARVPVCIEEEKELELLLEEMEMNQNMPLSEEILNLESRSSFGKNQILEELAQKMKQEMKSDQQYYSTIPLISRIENIKEKEDVEPGKIDDRGRRLFIDRVKLAERQKKHLDFQKKRDELRKFLLDKAKTTKQEPKIETKAKHIELTSAEAEKILKDRAKQRAARRNVVFTDEELDALIQKASRNFYKKKVKRSVQPKQRRHINMQLLERTMHSDPISEKESLNMENNNSVRKQRDINSRTADLKSKLAEHSQRFDDEEKQERENDRFERSVDMDSKLSQYKMKLAERSRKWDDMKDELLGNTQAMRENIKEKLQDLKSRRRYSRDLRRAPTMAKYKMKLAERSRKWDEKRDERLENSETRRENIKEKLRTLRNEKRFRRDLKMDTRMAQYEMKLAETKRKWEEKKQEILGNTETMRKNIEEKLEELKNKKRFTRDLKFDSKISQYRTKLAERSKKWDEGKDKLLRNTETTKESLKEKLRGMKNSRRSKRDINMDLLDTNTRGQKKGEKQKLTKGTINSKKLKDAEATIRQPGQTSSELVEDSLEMGDKSEELKPAKKEVYAELADSDELEEDDFLHTTPKSKKFDIFKKKSKLDPFAVVHPTIDIVEPVYKKTKKSKSKSEDELQFLSSSEEFTDIEDDMPCIHEYFGPDSSFEDKKTKKLMRELGEIFEDEKLRKKKSKKEKKVSDEDLRRRKRDLGEENYDEFRETDGGLRNTNIKLKGIQDSTVHIETSSEVEDLLSHEKPIDYLSLPENSNHSVNDRNSVLSDEDFDDQSMTSNSEITEGHPTSDNSQKVQSNNPISQEDYLPEEIRVKRLDKKPTSLGSLDIEDDFQNYRKEMKKHLKDLKNILEDDKLKFEEKKQKNKLKLLQLKKKQELELANEADDKLTQIHNEEHEQGNQLLEQLKNLKKELQLRKDKIDQVLRKDSEGLGLKSPKWNEIKFNAKKTINDLSDGLEKKLEKLHPKDLSSRIKAAHQETKQPPIESTTTIEIATIKPTVIVQKRSIFDTRRNVFDTYQPMSLDLRMWKPSDVLTLQKDLNPLGIKNLSPPDDLHIFQNLLGQNKLFRKRRSIDLDEIDDIDNDIDNDISNDIDDSLNEIKKDSDYLPDEKKSITEEDYKFVLPNKDKFEIIEKNGDTEIKFDHHETLRTKNPKASFEMTDPLSNFFRDDSISGDEKADSEEDKHNEYHSRTNFFSEVENENTTGRVDDEAVHQKTPRSVDNIQKIANKEEAKIFENFINNFTGYLSTIGNHLKSYMKYMTNNN
ncbi:unnamed protein product [Phaedon cochleariae]|uniref:Heparanase n=1 Tax=Phaedon cochleariae TaxID=80249 RepID=A0A9P0DRI6_PHACE|nr:unnamed protein product [Phaedon cochleariae]